MKIKKMKYIIIYNKNIKNKINKKKKKNNKNSNNMKIGRIKLELYIELNKGEYKGDK